MGIDPKASGKKILLIEDDIALIGLYNTKLTLTGFVVDKARDGAEALDKLENNDYDIIMSDLSIPGIDGFGVLKQLRSSNWPSAKKPVIIFSNLSNAIDIQRAKELGATDYVVKISLTPNQIVEKLISYLK